MKTLTARRRSVFAFTLVEVALAMGVASFCLIAVLGLVPLGVDTGQMAADQTAAGSILTHVLADLRATPPTSPPGGTGATSLQYGIAIPASGAGSTVSPIYFGDASTQFSKEAAVTTARYRLTINFLPSTGVRPATLVNLMVSWPARVDPTITGSGGPTGRVQILAALDRN